VHIRANFGDSEQRGGYHQAYDYDDCTFRGNSADSHSTSRANGMA
jgi:hypothetical protein